jgi:RNA polymerase sigma-70 factor (ECF subfamily)
MSLDALLAAQALRDADAFALLFDRYWESVFRFCYYRLGDWHQAEDAAGQVFVNAFDSLGRFDSHDRDDAFRAWLFGIARHVVASNVRYLTKHPIAPLDAADDVADATASLEEIAIATERHERLRQAMSQMPADQRELLELRLAGLSAAQIGEILGKSQEAVRKAQSRTVGSLRAALNEPTTSMSEYGHG